MRLMTEQTLIELCSSGRNNPECCSFCMEVKGHNSATAAHESNHRSLDIVPSTVRGKTCGRKDEGGRKLLCKDMPLTTAIEEKVKYFRHLNNT